MPSGAIILDETDVRVPADVFDLAGFRRWVHGEEFPQRGRYSYIGGEVLIDMSPEEIQSHNKVKMGFGRDLGSWIELHDLGDLLADRALLVNLPADLSTEPDLMFCSWEGLLSGRVGYKEFVEGTRRQVEVFGSPDMVLEIISRSSVRKDTILLPPRYFAAGVLEFWLVDCRGTDIEFRIFRRGDEDWEEVPQNEEGYVTSDVFQGRFKLGRRRDPAGGWRYKLLAAK